MNINKTFIKIWSIDLDKSTNKYSIINHFIPPEWQLYLVSDGSLTNNLRLIKEDYLSLTLIKQEKQLYYSLTFNEKLKIPDDNNILITREIWLTNIIKTKFLFAKSYYKTNNIYMDLISYKKPLGASFVESEIEIYRRIHSIYYGYSHILEKEFKIRGPIWGRSYDILCNNEIIFLIHEFFSPISIDKI